MPHYPDLYLGLNLDSSIGRRPDNANGATKRALHFFFVSLDFDEPPHIRVRIEQFSVPNHLSSVRRLR